VKTSRAFESPVQGGAMRPSLCGCRGVSGDGLMVSPWAGVRDRQGSGISAARRPGEGSWCAGGRGVQGGMAGMTICIEEGGHRRQRKHIVSGAMQELDNIRRRQWKDVGIDHDHAQRKEAEIQNRGT
jgi:hypothetical protein